MSMFLLTRINLILEFNELFTIHFKKNPIHNLKINDLVSNKPGKSHHSQLSPSTRIFTYSG